MDSALYSGSVLRFFIILGLLFFYPIIAYSVNRKIEKGVFLKDFIIFSSCFSLIFFFIIFIYSLSQFDDVQTINRTVCCLCALYICLQVVFKKVVDLFVSYSLHIRTFLFHSWEGV